MLKQLGSPSRVGGGRPLPGKRRDIRQPRGGPPWAGGGDVMGVDEGDEEEDEETGEPDVHVKHRGSHREPSKAERAEHERTHLPYRTWCKHCVAGRGVATRHKERDKDKRSTRCL